MRSIVLISLWIGMFSVHSAYPPLLKEKEGETVKDIDCITCQPGCFCKRCQIALSNCKNHSIECCFHCKKTIKNCLCGVYQCCCMGDTSCTEQCRGGATSKKCCWCLALSGALLIATAAGGVIANIQSHR